MMIVIYILSGLAALLVYGWIEFITYKSFEQSDHHLEDHIFGVLCLPVIPALIAGGIVYWILTAIF